MATCKSCGEKIEWGNDGTRFVPLVPLGEEGTHPRTHVDGNGELRVKHNSICTQPYRGAIMVKELAKPLEWKIKEPTKKRTNRKKKDADQLP